MFKLTKESAIMFNNTKILSIYCCSRTLFVFNFFQIDLFIKFIKIIVFK